MVNQNENTLSHLRAEFGILYIKTQLIFFLSADYFGTGKGYKLEIWQEGVVSKYKERFFLIQNISACFY